MKPKNRRVRAQRKFAQGAYIPQLNLSTERRRDNQNKEDPPPSSVAMVHSSVVNTSARSLLDIVSFNNVHSHDQPIVLLERLSSPVIPSSSKPVVKEKSVETNNNLFNDTSIPKELTVKPHNMTLRVNHKRNDVLIGTKRSPSISQPNLLPPLSRSPTPSVSTLASCSPLRARSLQTSRSQRHSYIPRTSFSQQHNSRPRHCRNLIPKCSSISQPIRKHSTRNIQPNRCAQPSCSTQAARSARPRRNIQSSCNKESKTKTQTVHNKRKTSSKNFKPQKRRRLGHLPSSDFSVEDCKPLTYFAANGSGNTRQITQDSNEQEDACPSSPLLPSHQKFNKKSVLTENCKVLCSNQNVELKRTDNGKPEILVPKLFRIPEIPQQNNDIVSDSEQNKETSIDTNQETLDKVEVESSASSPMLWSTHFKLNQADYIHANIVDSILARLDSPIPGETKEATNVVENEGCSTPEANNHDYVVQVEISENKDEDFKDIEENSLTIEENSLTIEDHNISINSPPRDQTDKPKETGEINDSEVFEDTNNKEDTLLCESDGIEKPTNSENYTSTTCEHTSNFHTCARCSIYKRLNSFSSKLKTEVESICIIEDDVYEFDVVNEEPTQVVEPYNSKQNRSSTSSAIDTNSLGSVTISETSENTPSLNDTTLEQQNTLLQNVSHITTMPHDTSTNELLTPVYAESHTSTAPVISTSAIISSPPPKCVVYSSPIASIATTNAMMSISSPVTCPSIALGRSESHVSTISSSINAPIGQTIIALPIMSISSKIPVMVNQPKNPDSGQSTKIKGKGKSRRPKKHMLSDSVNGNSQSATLTDMNSSKKHSSSITRSTPCKPSPIAPKPSMPTLLAMSRGTVPLYSVPVAATKFTATTPLFGINLAAITVPITLHSSTAFGPRSTSDTANAIFTASNELVKSTDASRTSSDATTVTNIRPTNESTEITTPTATSTVKDVLLSRAEPVENVILDNVTARNSVKGKDSTSIQLANPIAVQPAVPTTIQPGQRDSLTECLSTLQLIDRTVAQPVDAATVNTEHLTMVKVADSTAVHHTNPTITQHAAPNTVQPASSTTVQRADPTVVKRADIIAIKPTNTNIVLPANLAAIRTTKRTTVQAAYFERVGLLALKLTRPTLSIASTNTKAVESADPKLQQSENIQSIKKCTSDPVGFETAVTISQDSVKSAHSSTVQCSISNLGTPAEPNPSSSSDLNQVEPAALDFEQPAECNLVAAVNSRQVKLADHNSGTLPKPNLIAPADPPIEPVDRNGLPPADRNVLLPAVPGFAAPANPNLRVPENPLLIEPAAGPDLGPANAELQGPERPNNALLFINMPQMTNHAIKLVNNNDGERIWSARVIDKQKKNEPVFVDLTLDDDDVSMDNSTINRVMEHEEIKCEDDEHEQNEVLQHNAKADGLMNNELQVDAEVSNNREQRKDVQSRLNIVQEANPSQCQSKLNDRVNLLCTSSLSENLKIASVKSSEPKSRNVAIEQVAAKRNKSVATSISLDDICELPKAKDAATNTTPAPMDRNINSPTTYSSVPRTREYMSTSRDYLVFDGEPIPSTSRDYSSQNGESNASRGCFNFNGEQMPSNTRTYFSLNGEQIQNTSRGYFSLNGESTSNNSRGRFFLNGETMSSSSCGYTREYGEAISNTCRSYMSVNGEPIPSTSRSHIETKGETLSSTFRANIGINREPLPSTSRGHNNIKEEPLPATSRGHIGTNAETPPSTSRGQIEINRVLLPSTSRAHIGINGEPLPSTSGNHNRINEELLPTTSRGHMGINGEPLPSTSRCCIGEPFLNTSRSYWVVNGPSVSARSSRDYPCEPVLTISHDRSNDNRKSKQMISRDQSCECTESAPKTVQDQSCEDTESTIRAFLIRESNLMSSSDESSEDIRSTPNNSLDLNHGNKQSKEKFSRIQNHEITEFRTSACRHEIRDGKTLKRRTSRHKSDEKRPSPYSKQSAEKRGLVPNTYRNQSGENRIPLLSTDKRSNENDTLMPNTFCDQCCDIRNSKHGNTHIEIDKNKKSTIRTCRDHSGEKRVPIPSNQIRESKSFLPSTCERSHENRKSTQINSRDEIDDSTTFTSCDRCGETRKTNPKTSCDKSYENTESTTSLTNDRSGEKTVPMPSNYKQNAESRSHVPSTSCDQCRENRKSKRSSSGVESTENTESTSSTFSNQSEDIEIPSTSRNQSDMATVLKPNDYCDQCRHTCNRNRKSNQTNSSDENSENTESILIALRDQTGESRKSKRTSRDKSCEYTESDRDINREPNGENAKRKQICYRNESTDNTELTSSVTRDCSGDLKKSNRNSLRVVRGEIGAPTSNTRDQSDSNKKSDRRFSGDQSGENIVRTPSTSCAHGGEDCVSTPSTSRHQSDEDTETVPSTVVIQTDENIETVQSDQAVQLNNRPATLLRFPRGIERAKIVDAPIYYPTLEEFKDPITYFEKIMATASKYGLCKVVAPEGFKPSCNTSDDIRFKVSNQYIARMYSRWGPAQREICAIKAYSALQSVPFTRAPLLNCMELDLAKLYHLVQFNGGLKKVIEKKRWIRVAEQMRYCKNPQQVKKLDIIYVKYLLPYHTLSHQERHDMLSQVERCWLKKNQRMLDRAFNPLHRQKRLLGESDSSTDDEDDDYNVSSALQEAEDCVVLGRNMNLAMFKQIAANIMELHFPPNGDPPTLENVEKDYWRVVLLGTDHVCVNSASIDTGNDGYGFSKNKNDAFGKHPWNLKMLSQNPGNVLRSLGSVLGVTVPTLHLGMVFSTSCWHRDPHGLPWVEYMHTGPGKIWYGIPNDQSDNFRKAVETLCPTSCQNKSIWLPSDIAMIPPSLLREHNVSLSRVVQNPGEFIIVFPKAYSCSIATGFTISESVYFATNSWLETVHHVFQELRESCEPTMFSLEHLLVSIAKDSRSSLRILQRVYSNLSPIVRDELEYRNALLMRGVKLAEDDSPARNQNRRRRAGAWNVREQDECEICRTTLYFSKVVGITNKRSAVCILHALRLLESVKYGNKDPSNYEMVLNFSDKDLNELLLNVQTLFTRN
ncbi:uncharacterized protein LOC114247211 isoform X1 [Bombyx mandarina]|uniref:Uncharacterized protein LOC114247211 isoform X1 n=1 Tax=Bombyx mandarina TaxID=7092 RepID=A0A6J2K1Y7_BOMMA|nr:uncharacterized protein LOC114247211 isoform X1 [Bombyx mandarina]